MFLDMLRDPSNSNGPISNLFDFGLMGELGPS